MSIVRRILTAVPRLLASMPHIIGLIILGFWLVVFPALGIVHPSAETELIGGNYTNVTSDIGACIAAGGTIHIVRQHHKLHELVERLHRKLTEQEEHEEE